MVKMTWVLPELGSLRDSNNLDLHNVLQTSLCDEAKALCKQKIYRQKLINAINTSKNISFIKKESLNSFLMFFWQAHDRCTEVVRYSEMFLSGGTYRDIEFVGRIQ